MKTISITIKLGEPLRQTVGQRRLSLDLPETSTIAALLTRLKQDLPRFESGWQQGAVPYVIFHQGRPVSVQRYTSTRLKNGDVLYVVMPVCGG
jgi:sulfur carrier protein ThiS